MKDSSEPGAVTTGQTFNSNIVTFAVARDRSYLKTLVANLKTMVDGLAGRYRSRF
jgi:hypothetical protein